MIIRIYFIAKIKDLEIYFDLIKKKNISELEIETDQIRIKIVSENKNIKFSTQQTASEKSIIAKVQN